MFKEENSPNLTRDINVQIQEVEQTPNRLNPKKFILRNIIIKHLKTKEQK